MSQQPLTAAAIIRFSTDLEDDSQAFYEALAGRFPEQEETFARFAKDCAKSSTTVTRTYQETITDALEAGFSFEGIALSDYGANTDLSQEVDLSQAVGQAIDLEEKAIAFYQDVAEASESLLATIPRAFRRVARTRRRRKESLEAL
jgi:rubrerythrin